MHDESRIGADRLAVFRRQIHRQIAFKKMSAPVTSPDGSMPIIVVGEHELASDVMVQAERTGGCANLFVVMDDDRIIGAGIVPTDSGLTDDSTGDDSEPVHLDAEFGMLVVAASASTEGMRFRIELPSHSGEVRDAKRLQLA